MIDKDFLADFYRELEELSMKHGCRLYRKLSEKVLLDLISEDEFLKFWQDIDYVHRALKERRKISMVVLQSD